MNNFKKVIATAVLIAGPFVLVAQPPLCSPIASFPSDNLDHISNVTLVGQSSTLNNSSGWGTVYVDYTTVTPTADLLPGNPYNLSVNGGSIVQAFGAWIDYDRDGVCQPGEFLDDCLGFPCTISFTVPPLTTPGTCIMRVISQEDWGVNTGWETFGGYGPCGGSYSWMECEDYYVTILPLAPINMSASAFLKPSDAPTCRASAGDSVVVRVTNNGSNPITFSTLPCTVSCSVTGPNPTIFPNIILSTGTLASFASQDVVISTNYMMTNGGTYNFTSYTTVSGDGYAGDDTVRVAKQSTNPIVTTVPTQTICQYDSTTLTSTATPIGNGPGTVAYSSSNDVPILDFQTSTDIINVTGPYLTSDLISLTVDTIFHTWDSDLWIYIAAPNFTTSDLSFFNGGAGDNFIMTEFSDNAITPIASGVAPFTGMFIPDAPLSTLTGTATGNWTISVYDGAGADQGFLSKWTLEFPAFNTITSYLWAPSAGLNSTTIASPVASPTVTTTYTLIVTDANGCTSSQTVLVNVNPIPVVDLGNDTGICSLATITLDAGNPGSTYLWSTSATTQTINVTTSGSYIVAVTDPAGCATVFDTINVSINPLPVVALGNDTAVCQGDSVVLDAGNVGAAYLWNTGATTQTITVGSFGTYIVTVTGTGNCSQSDTINVSINIVPTVNLGPDTAICATTIIFDGGNPGCNYLWSTTATTQTISVGTTGVYYVTVTSTAGCVASDTVSVTVYTSPTVPPTADTTICAGDPVTLVGPNGFSSYVWTNGTFTSIGQSVTDYPGTQTNYILTVSDVNGCTNTDTVTVFIEQAPVANFWWNIVGLNTVNFTNTTTGSNLTFLWNFGDLSPTSTVTNPTHVYAANGTYIVTLVATNACGTDSAEYAVTIQGLSVNDLSNGGSLNLYPNPTQGEFTIDMQNTNADEVIVEISDMQGRAIFLTSDKVIGNAYLQKIDLSNYANGVYQVKINTGTDLVIQKLILSK